MRLKTNLPVTVRSNLLLLKESIPRIQEDTLRRSLKLSIEDLHIHALLHARLCVPISLGSSMPLADRVHRDRTLQDRAQAAITAHHQHHQSLKRECCALLVGLFLGATSFAILLRVVFGGAEDGV